MSIRIDLYSQAHLGHAYDSYQLFSWKPVIPGLSRRTALLNRRGRLNKWGRASAPNEAYSRACPCNIPL
jgi:hypothetical protein